MKELIAQGPVDVNVSPVARWTGSVMAHAKGGFVAYSDYLRLVECARQALWHIGTDDDRADVVAAGRGWATDCTQAAEILRAELRRANVK